MADVTKHGWDDSTDDGPTFNDRTYPLWTGSPLGGFWMLWPAWLNPSYINKTAPVEPVDKAGRERGLTAAQPGDPIPYVFGQTLVTPLIIAVAQYNGKLYVDYLLSQGECQEITEIFVNAQSIGKPASVAEGGTWEYFLGTSGQATSTQMATALGATYNALDGLCHMVAVLDADDSIDIKVQMKGIKLLDPRSSPVAESYSTNPALMLARIFVDSGYTPDWTTVATAANHCDEAVTDGVRWTCNVPVMNRRPLREWVSTMAAYAHVLIDNHGGQIKFIPDQKVTSSPAVLRYVTEDNILAGTARTSKVGSKDVPEQVIVAYRQPDGNTRQAIAGAGGSGERTTLQMPGFETYSMAKRMAVETLNKAKADLRHTHVTHDAGLSDAIGDIHSISYAPHGLGTKLMRLVNYHQVARGRWQREYIEYNENLYDDSNYVEPPWNDSSLPNANAPPAGPTTTVTEEIYTDQTATTYSRLKISWTGINYVYAQLYKVIVEGEQRIMNQMVNHDGVVEHIVYTGPVTQGVRYEIYVSLRSETGALGEPSRFFNTASSPNEYGIVALGKQLPPGDVPAYTSLGEAGGMIYAQWLAAAEIDGDLRGYILKLLPNASYTGTAADWTNANTTTVANRLDAQSILFPGPTAGVFWLGIKAIDTAGNVSLNALWGEVTVTTDAWQTNFQSVIESADELVNMHVYTIDGINGARYCITSLGETWLQRFGNTSPLATWGDTVTQSPAERWGGDLATDSTFVSAVWDKGATVDGSWTWNDSTVTVYGGTQANAILVSGDSSPLSFSETAGSTVQAAARYAKAKVYTSDSPATAGDGLLIKLPVQLGFSGEVVPQSGVLTISDSPVSMPYTVTFTTAYSGVPKVSATVGGSTAKIVALDNVSATSMDIWLWDTSGTPTDGVVYWFAEGV